MGSVKPVSKLGAYRNRARARLSRVIADNSKPQLDRRNFLVGSAIAAGAAAGLAIGVGVEQALVSTHRLPPRPEGPGFDHLVVLMFENRSMDNVFGYLYSPEGYSLPTGQQFDGLAGRAYANTAPDGTVVLAHPYSGSLDTIMNSPTPNSGEEYPHVNTQLFGTIDPPTNAFAAEKEMLPPFNAPPSGTKPTMDGFVTDYINNYRTHTPGAPPTVDEYSIIMGSFTPAMLPTFATLAKNFAVYDHWFGAAPTQTFANRSIFHASTSSGFVLNSGLRGFRKWIDPALNNAPTIFNRLEDAGVSWAVYFHESQLISFTGLIHAPQLQPFWKTRFRSMTQFHDDVAAGTLPAYSFIEPRMIYNHNDMHPAVGSTTVSEIDGELVVGGGISDARAADALLHSVYESVRTSETKSGSNALNTMLLVTFDEAGGTYDHVPPPSASAPNDGPPGEMDFTFDRLGVRVPAMAISAYTASGQVINDHMHHSAVVATLRSLYDIAPLTERDRTARPIFNAVTLKNPRQPSTWPVTKSHSVPLNPEATPPSGATSPGLSPLAVGFLSMLLAKFGQPGDPIPKTYADAKELLEKHGRELFGV
jgi:phospholipase C